MIGHEISHTFDNEGSAFDSKGRVRNWWTPEDLAHFQAATQKLAAQYDTYKPFPDLALNGQQTLAENIADLADSPLPMTPTKPPSSGQAAPEQDGFSGDQQFFSPLARTGQRRLATPRYASRCSPTCTRPATTARWRSATSIPGTRLSTSSRKRSCTWRRESGCGSGERDTREGACDPSKLRLGGGIFCPWTHPLVCDSLPPRRCQRLHRSFASLRMTRSTGDISWLFYDSLSPWPPLRRLWAEDAHSEFVLRAESARFRNGSRRVVRYCPERAFSR